jgi:RNA polymerase sigma-70 factor (ECF subfamily)
MNYSDDKLLQLFKQGQQNFAFEQIVKKYQRKIYTVIRRMIYSHDDTHDVMQNTFIKAWKHLHDFRQESNLYTWLYRIAINETLTFISKSSHKMKVLLDENMSTYVHSLSDNLNTDVIEYKLQKAILNLPEKQRAVFNMKYYDNLKYEEMSEILGISVGALKAHYHLAVKKIEYFLIQD